MKTFFFKAVTSSMLFLISTGAYALCAPDDHMCRFHGIENRSAHMGAQHSHHTKGRQLTEDIPSTGAGLYFYAIWDDNSSGESADLDIDVLLPDVSSDTAGNTFPAGPYIISNNAADGGAQAGVDIFEDAGFSNSYDRHVDTYQYQITFSNNTATAVHSKDANGLAPIPDAASCIDAGVSDSCEHVQISGNVPTGIYHAGVTNFDVHNLADPSTPSYTVGAVLIKGDNEINGAIHYLSHQQDEAVEGSMTSRGETSEILKIGFDRHEFDPHAEGVVIDQYVQQYSSDPIYANPRTVTDGYMETTLQDVYRKQWGRNARDTINSKGYVDQTQVDMDSYAYSPNLVYQNTNFVSQGVNLEGLSAAQKGFVEKRLTYLGDQDVNDFVLTQLKHLEASRVREIEAIYAPTAEELIWQKDGNIIDKGIVASLYKGCYAEGSSKWSCTKATLTSAVTSVAYEASNFSTAFVSASLDEETFDKHATGDFYDPTRFLSKAGKFIANYNPAGFVKNQGKGVVKDRLKEKISSNALKDNWNGPADYSDLIDSKSVGPGKTYTQAQKKKIRERNMEHNNGLLRSDLDGSILDNPVQSKKGVPANMNQAEVDHIEARANGGTNSFLNSQILSKEQNIIKSNK